MLPLHTCSPQPICENCTSAPAETYCPADKAHFCSPCDEMYHSQSTVLLRHVRQPTSQVSGGGCSDRVLQSPHTFGNCPEHSGAIVDSVCLTCHEILCPHCISLGSHALCDESQHSLVSTVDAFSKAVGDDHHGLPETIKGDLETAIEGFDDSLKELLKNFKGIALHVESVERDALEVVNRFNGSQTEYLESVRRMFVIEYNLLEWLEDFRAQISSTLRPSQFLYLRKQLIHLVTEWFDNGGLTNGKFASGGYKSPTFINPKLLIPSNMLTSNHELISLEVEGYLSLDCIHDENQHFNHWYNQDAATGQQQLGENSEEVEEYRDLALACPPEASPVYPMGELSASIRNGLDLLNIEELPRSMVLTKDQVLENDNQVDNQTTASIDQYSAWINQSYEMLADDNYEIVSVLMNLSIAKNKEDFLRGVVCMSIFKGAIPILLGNLAKVAAEKVKRKFPGPKDREPFDSTFLLAVRILLGFMGDRDLAMIMAWVYKMVQESRDLTDEDGILDCGLKMAKAITTLTSDNLPGFVRMLFNHVTQNFEGEVAARLCVMILSSHILAPLTRKINLKPASRILAKFWLLLGYKAWNLGTDSNDKWAEGARMLLRWYKTLVRPSMNSKILNPYFVLKSGIDKSSIGVKGLLIFAENIRQLESDILAAESTGILPLDWKASINKKVFLIFDVANKIDRPTKNVIYPSQLAFEARTASKAEVTRLRVHPFSYLEQQPDPEYVV